MYPHSRGNVTTDPVFDFAFANNSSEILLLEKIEIHIIKIWTKLSGIPVTEFLHSVGTFEHEIDFEKPVNEMNFPDPMPFEANKPKRFKVQLNGFAKKCPGNKVQLKFWFYFNNQSIPTSIFFLAH